MLDKDVRIIKWACEEIPIMYRSPLDNKVHKYYPDFIVMAETKEGRKTYILELKPYKQTIPPKTTLISGRKRNSKVILREQTDYIRNQAKWEATKKYCEDKQWEFKIIHEKNFKFSR